MFNLIKGYFSDKNEIKKLEKDVKNNERYIETLEKQIKYERINKEYREKEIALDKKLQEKNLNAQFAWNEEENELALAQEERRLENKLRVKLSESEEELFNVRALARESEALIKIYEKKESSLERQVVEYRNIISELIALIPKVDLSKFNINVDVDVPQKDINVNCK